jgi:peptidoglycan/LPS O-acetylase OafA/YrhL
MAMTRQTHIDSLRGIAALIVIIVHYLAAFYPYTIFGTQGAYQQHTNLENIVFFPPFGIIVSGHFAICLFFILSGYVLSYRYLGEPNQVRKLVAAIIKRPIRLGGLVWFSIIVGSLLWYFGLFGNTYVSDLTSSKPWFSNFWKGDFDFSKLLVNLSTSSFSRGNIYNPPLWTIKIELYGSIMVYLFLLLFGQLKFRLLISILLVIAFYDSLYQGFWIGLAIAETVKHHKLIMSFISKTMNYYLFLIIFIYLSSYPNYVSHDFLAGTIYAILPDDKGFGGGYPMLSALLIFTLVISGEALKKHLNHPVFQFFGEISYGLYVMHFLVLGSISSWLFQVSNNYFGYHASFLVSFFVGLSIIIFVAHLATKYIDTPSIKFSTYIGTKMIDVTALLSFAYLKQLITKRST